MGIMNLACLPDVRASLLAKGLGTRLIAELTPGPEVGSNELSTLRELCADAGCAAQIRANAPLVEKLQLFVEFCTDGGALRNANELLSICGF